MVAMNIWLCLFVKNWYIFPLVGNLHLGNLLLNAILDHCLDYLSWAILWSLRGSCYSHTRSSVPSISHCCSCISADAISSEFFTISSLILSDFFWKIIKRTKLLWRHLHQIQENWAGRNFLTNLHVNSLLITYITAGMQRLIWTIKLPMDSLMEFIYGILWGTLDLACL